MKQYQMINYAKGTTVFVNDEEYNQAINDAYQMAIEEWFHGEQEEFENKAGDWVNDIVYAVLDNLGILSMNEAEDYLWSLDIS